MWVSDQKNSFNYLGSKYSILKWLLPLLPQSYSFVDLFGGSAVVTLNRTPISAITTYNDLNGDVVNFFRVLRDRCEELVTKLYLTPHSREEYNNAWYSEADDEVERARKFYVRLRQSFLMTGAQAQAKGWASTNNQTRVKISEATNKYIRGIDRLYDIVHLLQEIQIESRDFQWIIEHYATKKSLVYADPPYDPEKVSGINQYKNPFTTEDHIRLHDSIMIAPGMFAISGYDTDFMKNLYSEKCWMMHTGPKPKNAKRKTAVRECLWTNYKPNQSVQTLFQ